MELLRKLVNTIPDLIYIYSLETRSNVYANLGIRHLLGYSEDEIKSMGSEMLGLLMHPDDFHEYRSSIVPKYNEADDEDVIVHEYRMKTRYGGWKWLQSRELIFTRDADGRPLEISGILSDITEKKINTMILLANNQILQMVAKNEKLEAILDAITLNVEKIIPDSICSVLLLENTGKHVFTVSAPNLPPEYSRLLDGQAIGPAAGSCGTAMYRKEPVFVEAIDDDPLWENYRELALSNDLHACWSIPLFNTGGVVLGTIAVYYHTKKKPSSFEIDLINNFANVTAIAIQRKQEEDDLNHHKENLENMVRVRTAELEVEKEKALSADRLKSAFLASMSHELRTPLNSIIGFTGVLLAGRPGPLAPEQKKQLKIVQNSSLHLLSLINDVLDISKIEANEILITINTFNLTNLVKSVIESLSDIAAGKGLLLTFRSKAPSMEVNSDMVRLRQVIVNIVNNAIKYTDHGWVNITISREAQTATIRVSDSGPGISPDMHEKIFNPFIQITSGISRRHEGTGLGLYISKKLIELLGGTIELVSEPGKGSEFSIHLPLE